MARSIDLAAAVAPKTKTPKTPKAPDVRGKAASGARSANEGKRGSKTGRPRKGFPRDESDAMNLRVLPESIPTVEVDRVSTTEGKRVAVVLSERDWQALAAMREIDGVTASERIRTMIAVWRSVTEVGDLVDRLAKPTQVSRTS
ncbi:hypothetical protein ACX31A_09600 [Dermacoccus nishinomiyaensis]